MGCSALKKEIKTNLLSGVDVPDKEGLLGQASFAQDVLHLDRPDEVMPGEAIEVVHAELQHTLRQLFVCHGEGEGLVKLRVQGLTMHFGLVLVLAVRHKVDL